jgi:hypothetical protein
MPLGPLPTRVVQVLNLYLRCSICNVHPVKVKHTVPCTISHFRWLLFNTLPQLLKLWPRNQWLHANTTHFPPVVQTRIFYRPLNSLTNKNPQTVQTPEYLTSSWTARPRQNSASQKAAFHLISPVPSRDAPVFYHSPEGNIGKLHSN